MEEQATHTDWQKRKNKKTPQNGHTKKEEIEYTNNHEGLSNYSIYFNNYYSGRIDVDI